MTNEFPCAGEGLTMRCPTQCEECAIKYGASSTVGTELRSKAVTGTAKSAVGQRFAELDAAILKAIVAGNRRFYMINAIVASLAEPLSKGPHDAFRVVDRRLQSLRKRGLIGYEKGEWHGIA